MANVIFSAKMSADFDNFVRFSGRSKFRPKVDEMGVKHQEME